MTVACHLDAELKERLDKALAAPIAALVLRDDLQRLMAAAGMQGVRPNEPFWEQAIVSLLEDHGYLGELT